MPASTAANRLAHVLLHLEAAYVMPAAARFGYEAAAPVRLPAPTPAAEAFFQGSEPHPLPADVSWLESDGARVPVFFDGDLVSSIFYWLSGWQEVYSGVRDAFGRFPYAASLQARLDCLTLPVADRLLAALRRQLEASSGQPLVPKAVVSPLVVSHDVDHLLTGWRTALRHGYVRAAAGRLRGRDPFDNLPEVARLVIEETGTAPIFYFLGAAGAHALGPNADYDLAAPAVQRRVEALEKLGCAIGLHGSFGASEDAGQLQREFAKLGRPGVGVRFHYLRFDPVRTPEILAEVGAAHDATLGFAERAGFRHGTARPFRLYDFRNQRAFPTECRPLHAMDVTFRNAGYQPTAPEQIPGAVAALARNAGGALSLLWHNEYLVPWEQHLGEATLRAALRASRPA